MIDNENNSNIKMIEGNKYYFVLGPDCYLGTYVKNDSFIENNCILSFNNSEFSLPRNKIFNTKEQCIDFMNTTYKDKGYPYHNINFVNC